MLARAEQQCLSFGFGPPIYCVTRVIMVQRGSYIDNIVILYRDLFYIINVFLFVLSIIETIVLF